MLLRSQLESPEVLVPLGRFDGTDQAVAGVELEFDVICAGLDGEVTEILGHTRSRLRGCRQSRRSREGDRYGARVARAFPVQPPDRGLACLSIDITALAHDVFDAMSRLGILDLNAVDARHDDVADPTGVERLGFQYIAPEDVYRPVPREQGFALKTQGLRGAEIERLQTVAPMTKVQSPCPRTC